MMAAIYCYMGKTRWHITMGMLPPSSGQQAWLLLHREYRGVAFADSSVDQTMIQISMVKLN